MNKKPVCIILALFAMLCFNCFVGCSGPTPSPSPGPSVNGPTAPDGEETPDEPDAPEGEETPDEPDSPEGEETPDEPEVSDGDETPDEPDGPEWRFNSTTVNSVTTYEVSSYSGTSKNVIIPSTHEGGKVTGISFNAFHNSNQFESIYIPESITDISFSRVLTQRTFSSEDGIFTCCTNLKNIIVSENNPEYKSVDGILYSKDGKSLYCFPSGKEDSLFVVPETVEHIENYAFANCSNLTDIVLPQNLSRINSYAFANCSIQNIELPNNITELSGYNFSDCKTLTTVNAPSVTGIAIYAFRNCTNLTNVTFSNELYYIGMNVAGGDSVFENCIKLESIRLPQTVRYVSGESFRGCANLYQITVDEGNPYYKSVGGSLYDKDGTKLLRATLAKEETSFNVPNGVVSIENYAFSDMTSLATVTLPNDLTKIGFYAFQNCTSLTNVSLPDNLASIGSGAFENCTSLTNVSLPDTLTEIGSYAFQNCTNLTNVSLPDNLTEIGDWTFAYCTNLTTVTLPDNLASIGMGAFTQCTSLTNVTLPDNLASIDMGAFARCTSLTNVTLPDNLASIGAIAFAYCTNLTRFHIPKSAQFEYSIINYSCIAFCTSITNITVDEDNPYYKSVDGNLYSKDGTGLLQYALGKEETAFAIPDGTETVRSSALYPHNFQSIIIPKSVTVLESNLFVCTDDSPLTIYYAGTEAEWSEIQISRYTFEGDNYTIIYNYSPSGEN